MGLVILSFLNHKICKPKNQISKKCSCCQPRDYPPCTVWGLRLSHHIGNLGSLFMDLPYHITFCESSSMYMEALRKFFFNELMNFNGCRLLLCHLLLYTLDCFQIFYYKKTFSCFLKAVSSQKVLLLCSLCNHLALH